MVDHHVVVVGVINIGVIVHARQLQGLVGLANTVRRGLNMALFTTIDTQHIRPINYHRVGLSMLLLRDLAIARWVLLDRGTAVF